MAVTVLAGVVSANGRRGSVPGGGDGEGIYDAVSNVVSCNHHKLNN